jgi:hypothetical protein
MLIGLLIILITNVVEFVLLGRCIQLIQMKYEEIELVELLNRYLSVLFFLLLLALTISTVKVFDQMKKMFGVSTRNIKIMTILFDLAYLIRAILSCTVYPKIYNYESETFEKPETVYLWTIVPGVISDCLPLAIVMWLHHQNYKSREIEPSEAFLNDLNNDENDISREIDILIKGDNLAYDPTSVVK